MNSFINKTGTYILQKQLKLHTNNKNHLLLRQRKAKARKNWCYILIRITYVIIVFWARLIAPFIAIIK